MLSTGNLQPVIVFQIGWILFVLALFNDYKTADLNVYHELYFSIDLLENPISNYHYDILFYLFMTLGRYLDLSFELFHGLYIFVPFLIFSIVVIKTNLTWFHIPFFILLLTSPYLFESFRIFPVILFGGFLLYLTKPVHIFLLLVVLTGLHWSAIFVILLRLVMHLRNLNALRLIFLIMIIGLISFLFYYWKFDQVYKGYEHLATQYKLNGVRLISLSLHCFFLALLFKYKLISMRRFLLSFIIVSFLFLTLSVLVSYTGSLRLLQLLIFSFLLYLALDYKMGFTLNLKSLSISILTIVISVAPVSRYFVSGLE